MDLNDETIEYVYVPYRNEHMEFLESFGMIDFSTVEIHFKGTSHVLFIIDGQDVLSKIKVNSKTDLNQALTKL